MNVQIVMQQDRKEVYMSDKYFDKMGNFNYDKMAEDVYLEFANKHQKIIIDYAVCQICEENPSVRITRWGKVKAACQSCLNKEYENFVKQNPGFEEFDETI